MSKLADFLTKNKVDTRRLLAVSRKLEALRPEDTAQKSLRAKVKAGGADLSDEQKAQAKAKPRSGRPLTPPTLNAALAGDTVPGPAKTRIVKAVNAIVSTKKGAKEATLRDLF